MKTKNLKKLTVAALATALGAGLIGSISGSVAWFQYSTRSTVAYTGASAHCTESLQISLDGTNWASDLKTADVVSYLESQIVSGTTTRGDSYMRPVTSGELAAGAVADTFYKNPLYQYPETSKWGVATKKDYVELPLQFRVLDVDGESTETLLAKDVYLTRVDIQEKAVSGKKSIADAIRVAVPGAGTFSTSGADVDVYGKLRLHEEGATEDDKTGDFEWETREDIIYGDNGKVAKSYAMTGTDGLADDSDPYNISGTALGTTTTSGAMFTLTVRIYIEGWTKLEGSAIWEAADYVGSQVNVGFRFSVEAHEDHA